MHMHVHMGAPDRPILICLRRSSCLRAASKWIGCVSLLKSRAPRWQVLRGLTCAAAQVETRMEQLLAAWFSRASAPASLGVGVGVGVVSCRWALASCRWAFACRAADDSVREMPRTHDSPKSQDAEQGFFQTVFEKTLVPHLLQRRCGTRGSQASSASPPEEIGNKS